MHFNGTHYVSASFVPDEDFTSELSAREEVRLYTDQMVLHATFQKKTSTLAVARMVEFNQHPTMDWFRLNDATTWERTYYFQF